MAYSYEELPISATLEFCNTCKINTKNHNKRPMVCTQRPLVCMQQCNTSKRFTHVQLKRSKKTHQQRNTPMSSPKSFYSLVGAMRRLIHFKPNQLQFSYNVHVQYSLLLLYVSHCFIYTLTHIHYSLLTWVFWGIF